MQSPFNNKTEFRSQTFSNLSELNQDICNIEFDNCHFEDCNFTESIFKKCRFSECTFSRCNLSVIKVYQSQFTDVVFNECKILGVDWTRAAWPRLVFSIALKFNQCILNDSSFYGLNLDQMTIEGCKAHDVDFRDGSFRNVNFTYTDFTNSLFGKTNLVGADFSEATDYDIDIFNNKIEKAKFSRYEAARLLYSLNIELVD